jgi:hypothetical protein
VDGLALAEDAVGELAVQGLAMLGHASLNLLDLSPGPLGPFGADMPVACTRAVAAPLVEAGAAAGPVLAVQATLQPA